ncbi:KPN_02809 family neutral zinc metallopeptidase [Phycicoccus sonneratiae]|uniref:Neutral zinc metallopeptidase n=1 Tax=Phycicoccus sonneratiae TaxID=2807628 RepID=A0ABS2CKG9_9MICO|nr:neutral zinc metallopeptidase [Phycicoccus sonneraticus]MBM6399564.1 neutral zinc metallopeptidase [Phycicoccus sonneraticus]
MSFNDNVTLDTSQVRSGGGGGRGGPGGLVVGGGIGGIILTILLMVFGIDPGSLPTGGGQLDPGQVQAGGTEDGSAFDECKSGADANSSDVCRVVGTVNSVQAFWGDELVRHKREWQPTQTVLYDGQTQSACGTASNQVGPFYCPLDKLVYIDASFFELLTSRFGADDGALAQEYVVAHEYGHALQDQLGLLGRAQQDPQGAESGAVRTELMADCLAGVWAKHASSVPDEDTGTPFLRPITDADIRSALSAAKAVGDDTIQASASGRVNPETWTHGSAEARQRWFLQGYSTGDLNRCDTFAVASVE